MSISASQPLANSRFTPFFQKVRGGSDGTSPVGTFSRRVNDIGDGSGGIVTLSWTMQRILFGFRAILAPTLIITADDLATAEAVKLSWVPTGNKRIPDVTEQVELAVAAEGGNFAKFEPSGIMIESDIIVAGIALQCVWSTNTNLKLYDAVLFGSVFDAELIAAQGSISDFLAGVR